MTMLLLMILAVIATSARVLGLIGLSIITGWFLAYQAVKSRAFENVFISSIEVFESVPVISFFPVVLSIFILGIGGPLGVEFAADFLVFTAVVWNIWIGQYQAFKTVPKEMLEVTQNFRFSFFDRMRYLFIPYSVPRISANLFPSVSDAFFYITVSEVFVVGVHSYQTFGVGTLLDAYVASSMWPDVFEILLILGVAIVLIILALRAFSRRAVSKYALDTDVPIVRRGRLNVRESLRFSAVTSVNPLNKLAQYNRARRPHRKVENDDYYEEARKHSYRAIWVAVGIVLLGLVIFGIYRIVSSVSTAEWNYLIGRTPSLLLDMLYDYLRVGIIVVASFIFSIFVGYYLAVNRKAEAVGVPVIQAFSAYPTPTYFPFFFLAVYPFIYAFFGQLTGEFFVLFLGFISTFYYVFYNFWMGVKAMPSEYYEIMENLNLSFFQKMRLIVMPATFPYLISGISSTINSAWGGLMIGEFWPDIIGHHSLSVGNGLMKVIDVATNTGNIALAAWGSFLFGIVVAVYSILFTRKMMDLARKKYVAEEGIYAA
ncbi:MAG: ABC transporter permease subunit [Thermoplasmata archaeon]|uniref:ABC transporter permease subunit n=1 Tax=Candidatus Sysuiplasma superficiale TaxID=2823368 RepID=A0A8J7YJ29_9ARCH|nr:ABC transporter permease subunit [Candidatus Sysuiplasma superficiale]MBX8644976.1 ABC transporter permease subunit [Candidatus Sysuiplasma superficiale]